MDADLLFKLISDTYSPLESIKNKIDTNDNNIKNNYNKLLKNISFRAYVIKSGYRKTVYKTFYARYIDKISIYKESFLNGTLQVNKLGEKNLVSLRNISTISQVAYDLITIIVKDFVNDLCNNSTTKVILNDDKFQQTKKELNTDIKYHIHKEVGVNKYPNISLQKFEINIIYTKESENKKIIYKISSEDCNKIFNEKNSETFINCINWLNEKSNRCYAKILPLKITVGIRNISDIISDSLLESYHIASDKKNLQCIVFNSHFEGIIVYNINKKIDNTTITYMNEENIDDNLIFINDITDEKIEETLNTLTEYNIGYIKNTYSLNNDISLDDNNLDFDKASTMSSDN